MKVYFRVNQTEVEVGARPTGKDWEPIAIDRQLGEFYLTEEDEIEMREGDGEWFPVPLAYVHAWFNQPISNRMVRERFKNSERKTPHKTDGERTPIKET